MMLCYTIVTYSTNNPAAFSAMAIMGGDKLFSSVQGAWRQTAPWHTCINVDVCVGKSFDNLNVCVGAKYCTQEINTSEIIVDFQRHFPMDIQ